MRKMVTLIICLALAPFASAGPKKVVQWVVVKPAKVLVRPFFPPQTYDDGTPRLLPAHFYRDPKWLFGDFLIAASVGMDAYSTILRSGPIIEGNHLLGTNPSRSRVIGLACLSFGLQTTYHAVIWHYYLADGTEPKGWQVVEYGAIPTESSIIYGYFGAVHNFGLEFPKFKKILQ